MKSRITYSSHPKIVQAGAITLTVASIGSLAVFLLVGIYPFTLFCQILMFGAEFAFFSSGYIEICDESKTLTMSSDKRHPIELMKVDRLVRHVNGRDKVKTLTLHETGVRYADIRIRPDRESEIVERILNINPAIEVVTRYD